MTDRVTFAELSYTFAKFIIIIIIDYYHYYDFFSDQQINQVKDSTITLSDVSIFPLTPTPSKSDTLNDETLKPQCRTVSEDAHTYYGTPQNHTPIYSTALFKMSLAYATPPLFLSDTSFHAIPVVNTSPQIRSSIPLHTEIEVPENITFEDVSCIFTRHISQFNIRNKTDRWIQCRLCITGVRRDAIEVS